MPKTTFLAVAVALFLAVPAHAVRVAAWVPAWDEKSLQSVQLHAGSLDESNPVWYGLNTDGSIAKYWNAENATWRAAMSGTDILPTVQNYVNGRFDGTLVATMLADPVRRERHAEALTQLAVTQAFQGIDIDYEALPGTARANFTAFVNTLAAKLHSAGKKLSVTVHPKTSDSASWNGPAAQDYAAIGAVADSVKIMAYDYSWSTSPAGPIAPLTWLENVAKYAVSVMPAGKVIMGLPWYGYDWSGSRGNGVTWTEAMATATSRGIQISRDANGEATYSYDGRVVYFQDAQSYARKVDALLQKYPSIGGFTHWRTGGEDPAIWDKVNQLTGTGGSGATTPSGDFTTAGASSLTVRAGESVSSSYGIIGINGFSSSTTVTATKVDSLSGNLSLSRSAITPGTSTTLTVSPASTAAAGVYRIRLRFTSGTLVRDQIVSVTVDNAVRKRAAKR